MLNPEDFVARWGVDDLIRFDPAFVNTLKIPESSRRFLIEAGLPKSEYVKYDVPPNTFPSLPELTRMDYTLPPRVGLALSEAYRRYRIIGIATYQTTQEEKKNDLTECHCIDEESCGRVVSIVPASYNLDWRIRFLNSSVPQLAEFMLLVREHYNWRDQIFAEEEKKPSTWTLQKYLEEGQEPERWGEEFIQKTIAHGQDIVRRLKAIDPPACAEETYWSDTITIMENGDWL